ncbi:hypothetical protein QL285_007071 [Trifolium repens]|nr:hypothetical protein QL285_007071 [Trifolium repens]
MEKSLNVRSSSAFNSQAAFSLCFCTGFCFSSGSGSDFGCLPLSSRFSGGGGGRMTPNKQEVSHSIDILLQHRRKVRIPNHVP